MSSTARPRFLWKATSLTPRALAVVRLSRLAYPPSAATCRGGTPQRVIWRSSMGRKRSASAGLPASTTTSRIKPLLPVTRLSLCPYCTSRTPLTMMSACGSNRLTSFSPAGTGCPRRTRRSLTRWGRASRGREWALPIPLWNGEAPLGRRCSDPGQADGWLSLHCGGSVRRTRFEHYRDPGRPRSFHRLARCATGRLKSRERLAHDPGAALGQGDQILTQPVDVLLDREATNLASFLAVTVPELGDRAVAPKELSLDHQRRIARPAGDPNEILVSGDGAVDQHHRRGRVTVLLDEPPSQIQQNDREVLIND